MPTIQKKQPDGTYTSQEMTDAEYAKISGSAGFITQPGQQGSGLIGPENTLPPGGNSGSGFTQKPPLTIDTPVTAPNWDTSLSPENKAVYDNELQDRLNEASQRSQMRLDEIRNIGKGKIGGAKGFLAKAGALGRSVSGATAESGIGVLGDITNKINLALSEEQDRLSSEQSLLRSDSRKEIQARVDKLNDLKQQTFTNALAVVNNSRAERADARAAADEGRLDRKEQRDIEERARKETVDTVNFLLNNFGPEVIEKMTTADLNEWETDLGMPLGSMLEGFKIVEQKKLEAGKPIKSSSFGTDAWTGDAMVNIIYEDGSTESKKLGYKSGTGFQPGSNETSGFETDEEKAFYGDIEQATKDLQSGTTWGQIFSRIKMRYSVDDDIIDKLLDKEYWSKEGAYQNFVKSTQKTTKEEEDAKTGLMNQPAGTAVKDKKWWRND